MAPTKRKPAAPQAPNQKVSFDDIIARKRREDAALFANKIMGKKRAPVKPVASIRPNTRSTTSITADKWQHDLHHVQNAPANNSLASRIGTTRVTKPSRKQRTPPTTVPAATANKLKNNRLFTALHGGPAPQQQQQQQQQQPPAPRQSKRETRSSANEFSIRGSAGPAVLQATNFAPGTTAEDIRHAMLPLGEILSCLILTAAPTVIAEIVFKDKASAEKCIAQYNGQRADGRMLSIEYKAGPAVAVHTQQKSADPYSEREEEDRKRRERNGVSYQDGRYGVSAPAVYSAPLYSDALMMKGRGFSGR